MPERHASQRGEWSTEEDWKDTMHALWMTKGDVDGQLTASPNCFLVLNRVSTGSIFWAASKGKKKRDGFSLGIGLSRREQLAKPR